MGDVVHSFAAVRDMALQGVELTWAVDESLADLVRLHPMVDHVIALPMRRFKREFSWRNLPMFFKRLRALMQKEGAYDVVIDAQGLLKSALLMRLAQGVSVGYDFKSAREGVASFFYKRKCFVEKNEHALLRTKRLCAFALGYDFSERVDFGLPLWSMESVHRKHLLFFHGTTWASKLLPVATWQALLRLANNQGYVVDLFWGSDEEEARAREIATAGEVVLRGRCDYSEIVEALYGCSGVISVDTGLGHLAGACGVPTLGIYGPTRVDLVGIMGKRVRNLFFDAPCGKRDCRLHQGVLDNACMAKWQASDIWQAFLEVL